MSNWRHNRGPKGRGINIQTIRTGDFLDMKKIITASLVTLGLLASPSLAKSGVKVGMLTCSVEGGVGFIIGSSKGADCVYQPAGGGRVEHYAGRIGKLGVDIGVTGQTTIAWVVFAPGKVKAGSLKGSYSGVSAEATVIGGVGANVLVGGFRKSINLQPLSIQAQTGLNVAAGIGSLHLDAAD
jgi:hypothetical protein